MMQQENQQNKGEQATSGNVQSNATAQPDEPKMAQNPNPRANENVRDTPMEDNTTSSSTSGVGSEITDGEAG
jgi:hypothetical protein